MQPTTTRRLFFAALLLAGLGWMIAARDRSGSSTQGQIPAPQAGFLAPDFTLTTLEGETVSLSDFRGQAVLVNYWATWCPPCKAEMPAMQRTYEAYRDQGFVVLAVNATNQDALADVEAFVREYGLTFPVLLDESGSMGALYRVNALPTSFFIRPDGVIEEVVIGGPMSEALISTRIETLLEAMP